MSAVTVRIRREEPRDQAAVAQVNVLAFGGDVEATLVDRRRANPGFEKALSFVAEEHERVIGHILFFPVAIRSENVECEALSLAPVLPEHQNQGVGARMIREGLDRAREAGWKAVLVLGHRDYYPKFGFERASLYGIRFPFDAPDEFCFAMELAPRALASCAGVVQYPAEFEDV